jgi:magnesium transporter
MSFALIGVLIFTYSLDAVLVSRSDLTSEPFSGMGSRRVVPSNTGFIARVKSVWQRLMAWVHEKLEIWTAAKDDKQIAWTLGIGWACCGGGLAGGCLVFAKAM